MKEPIAITGIACHFPQAKTKEEFFSHIENLSPRFLDLDKERLGVEPHTLMGEKGKADCAYCLKSAWVDSHPDTTKWDTQSRLKGLDPYFHWTLHVVANALEDANVSQEERKKTGLILANLIFATEHAQEACEDAILSLLGVDAKKKFSSDDLKQSALPALLSKEILGLGKDAWALDAACASSLYALSYACMSLWNHDADIMVTAGVNRSEMAALTVGFSQLNAYSKQGKCLPFDQDADGLVVGEGAGAIVLKRLSDAIANNDRIYALVRGFGLSCDGTDGGLLAPSSDGQVSALKNAYELSQVDPDTIDFIECHGTATGIGDATELKTMMRIFGERNQNPLGIGSVKSIYGHCLSAAGMASLLKMILALHYKKTPPTLFSKTTAHEAFSKGYYLVKDCQEWKKNSHEPRRAAVSGFGFGGTNAHIILEESAKVDHYKQTMYDCQNQNSDPVVICDLAIQVGRFDSILPVLKAFQENQSLVSKIPSHRFPEIFHQSNPKIEGLALEEMEMKIGKFRISPREATRLLPQQYLMLDLCSRVMDQNDFLSKKEISARTGVMVGLGFNPNITEHTTRLKSARIMEKLSLQAGVEKDLEKKIKDSICPPVNADDVIGDIPNFPANRISAQYDFHSPSHVIFQEEDSFFRAIQQAILMIQNNHADFMLAGGCDLPLDFRRILLNKKEYENQAFCEGGAIFLLTTRSKAKKMGMKEIACVELLENEKIQEGCLEILGKNKPVNSGKPCFDFEKITGNGSGFQPILDFAIALGLIENGVTVNGKELIPAILQKNEIRKIAIFPKYASNGILLSGKSFSESITSPLSKDFKLLFWGGKNREELIQKIISKPGGESQIEPGNLFRLALFADPKVLESKKEQAISWISSGKGNLNDPAGMFFRQLPKDFQNHRLAFVYPGFGNLYEGLGKEVLFHWPWLQEEMHKKTAHFPTLLARKKLWDEPDLFEMDVFEISFATTINSWMITKLLQKSKISLDAVIGFSGGEINCLSALGVWDVDAYFNKAQKDEVFSKWACKEFKIFEDSDYEKPIQWSTWLVHMEPEKLKKLCANQKGVWFCMVNGVTECMVAGISSFVVPFVKSLGCHLVRLPIPQIYHCNLLEPLKKELLDLWSHPVHPLFNVDFYSHAKGVKHEITQQSLSEAITRTCLEEVDFRPVIKNAYQDGIRIFVETGPQGSVSRLIQDILKDKTDFEAFSLNLKEKPLLKTFGEGLARLIALGKDVNLEILQKKAYRAIESGAKVVISTGRTIAMLKNILEHRTEKNSDEKSHTLPLQEMVSSSNAIREYILPEAHQNLQSDILLSKIFDSPVHTTVPVSRLAESTSGSSGFQETKKPLAERYNDLTPENFSVQTITDSPRLTESSPEELMNQNSHFSDPGLSQILEHRNRMLEVHSNFLQNAHQILKIHSSLSEQNFPSQDNNGPQKNDEQEYTECLFDKNDILEFAHGSIEKIFGKEFHEIDSYRFRTRFPSPPYLFVDRVTQMEAKTHEFKPCKVVTEFDVHEKDWFLVDNHVPICVCIESGQADLWLISYVGIDHKVKGERVYRLLGADFTIFNGFPKAPCTLRYEIQITSYTQHQGTWLFFFNGDGYTNGEKFIQWRNGCAGYFTYEELNAKQDLQIIPEHNQAKEPFRPVRDCKKNHFGKEEILSLVQGNVYSCFGKGFEVPFLAFADRTFPQFTNPDLLLCDEITVLKDGGRHGLGYLESTHYLNDNHWYFTSHFVTDNVMPGTLMLDGCTQLLEFYLLYLGFGFQARNGRFQVVPGEEIKVKCRGQVIPGNQILKTYVHITKIDPGSSPKVFADVLMTCDNKEVVHVKNLSMEIVYAGLPALPEPGKQAFDIEGRKVVANETQLIELTVGKPSRYFGDHYKIFDYQRQISRMPNPPYACITRVMEIEGEMRKVRPGARMLCEFDLYEDDWYFQANHGFMPFCVLNEVVLQPCGLLPQLLELDMMSKSDRFIRNLGGEMITYVDIPARNGKIICEVILKEVVDTAATFMVKYDGKYWFENGTLVAEGKNLHFGFFSQEGLAAAPGLTLKKEDLEWMEKNNRQSGFIDISTLPSPAHAGMNLSLPDAPALFFDSVVAYSPKGGRFEKGYLKVEKLVDPGEWIFYSHFYMDPVVPGSYSLDAVTQAARYFMLVNSMDKDGSSHFQQNFRHWMSWQYRGQILQKNSKIHYELEIKEVLEDAVIVCARVFCDGKFIYSLDETKISMI